ncbi:hypothetical protein V6N11_005887 [Hibiscus sabdariffa]|uniref:Uncharacterized protein n=1 Tax=Hibiscus sabdariffa TaxID=183260 RepID=A0ABR2RP22_9ROSI
MGGGDYEEAGAGGEGKQVSLVCCPVGEGKKKFNIEGEGIVSVPYYPANPYHIISLGFDSLIHEGGWS